MKRIPEAILEAIESVRLPPMPQVLLSFLRMVEDDHSSMHELAELVGEDPALSARVLTVANSAALHQLTEIKNLDQCLVALGTRLARTIASCLAIQSVFASTSAEQQYDFKGFWKHSLSVAEIARELAGTIEYPDIEEAYLAGLLHDVGQLLLLDGIGESYESVLGMSRDETALQANEQSLLGADHAEVGAWLLDQWKLSSFMADAVLFHHKSAEEIAAVDPLSQIVWAAHLIAEVAGAQETPSPDLTPLKELLGLDPDQAEAIRRNSSKGVATLAAALGVSVSPDARTLPCPPVTPFEKKRSKPEDDLAHAGIDAAVRDMAMLQPLQQNLSELLGENEILLAVRESARIIFGLGRLAFLLVNESKTSLSGAPVQGQPELLRRLEVQIIPGKSLAATTMLGESPHATFDEDRPGRKSLVDVQIARALDSEGVLYVPMRTGDRKIGLMAYGLSSSQFARTKKQLEWITNFAHSAAISIETWRTLREREKGIEDKQALRFDQKARKIAHEAGNPLGIIKNYLRIVRQRLPEESGVREEMEILREEVDRVGQIIRQLGSGGEAISPGTAVDVNVVIQGMLALYSDSLFGERGITVTTLLGSGLPLVAAERDAVKQVLLNLWKNAAEALSDGEEITISTDNPAPQKKQPPRVEIRIQDSGPGLPQDVLQNLFQPLPADRRQGHSGIGLSIVAELVQRMGGEITCQSSSETGTTFRILLPPAPRK